MISTKFLFETGAVMFLQYFRTFIVVVLAGVFLSACATLEQKNPDPQRMAAARRLILNMDAKSFLMLGIKKGIGDLDKESPGLAELTERIFSQPEVIRDAEEIVAKAYARYMTAKELNEFADFADSKTGKMVFRATFSNLSGENTSADIVKYLNADELEDLARFGQSDAVTGYQRAKKHIDRDMEKGVTALAEKAVREYLAKPPEEVGKPVTDI